MGYDDVISHMGEFGRYQRRIYFTLCLPAICCAFHKMGGVFLAAKTDFRCMLPNENPENATFYLSPDIINMRYPWDNKTESWSRCERYDNTEFADQGGNVSRQLTVVECDSFVYDKSQYALTATTEWNLVCNKGWLRAIGDSIFMVGVMLGSMIFGGLSDRYGRRAAFFSALITQLIGGILVTVSPEYVSYMISRMIVGSTTSGVFLVAYVIALEMVGPKKRLAAGMGCQLFFTSGYILTAGLAYFFTNWRTLQVVFTIPSIVFLAYWWFIPESARWLLTKGRVEDAKDLLQNASLKNGVALTRDTLDSLINSESDTSKQDIEKASMFDLLRYPNLRKKSLLLFFTWFVNSCTYYGLSWNTSNLGGNEFVNFGIAASVEVPAYLFLLFTLDKWGRKVILCGCMLIAGIALLLTVLVPAGMPWLVVVCAMSGKLAITSSYGAVYVVAAEQFPTALRNIGLGACSFSARIGGIIAPYINHLAEVWAPLPLVIFGSCSFLAGLLSLYLPETLNAKLPESIQDGEHFGKKKTRSPQGVEKLKDIEVMKALTLPSKIVINEKQNTLY
ncbi:organic cation transporter protein [Neodiprion lecontei]|uniref:Organic cation transporter protein n=1 Tax=Neodiprion lecontei TaxID=441921 RepID=A0A6J0CE31_NEOLC|nr:organic cation transporter protein [Neodiprion lecontei]XP_046592572.1 organic cation transporter protein [Neodiprion lecontei]XP_046592578.1 organic cation transporter protein [Neodiprion lecontei]